MFKFLQNLMLNNYSWLRTIEPVVLVHGGAGDICDYSVPCKLKGVKIAARIGYETLDSTGSALEAVQSAVRSMELDQNFNAGYGSVLTWEGKVEMDAAIMNGEDLDAGCVSVVQNVAHPIELARSVMQKTRHKYLAGEGAMIFAAEDGFEILPEGALVTPTSLQELEDYKNSLNPTSNEDENLEESLSRPESSSQPGTVGAVAIDAYGNVAAATSTGGLIGKMPGRIGDSPILGGGTYADNSSGTVSVTGNGEAIMRYSVASRILGMTQCCGMSAQLASTKVLDDMKCRLNETAGVITIDHRGTLGIYFTSRRMSWAYQRGDELHFGIEKCEDNVELVTERKLSLCELEMLKKDSVDCNLI